jgi:hypothetical protein
MFIFNLATAKPEIVLQDRDVYLRLFATLPSISKSYVQLVKAKNVSIAVEISMIRHV